MTTLTIEQGNNTETVSNAVIQKLYNIASNSTNVTLAGNLQCERCYQDVYDYFTGYVTEDVKRFPNMSLTVTGGRYATFSDPVILDYFAKSTYGDGTGVPANSIFSILTLPRRENGSNVSIVDSVNGLNGGKYAFYKDKNVTSFNELGQFSNITTIPTGMFRESTLKYIDLSNIINIEAGAFASADLTGIINLPKFKQWGGRSNHTRVDVDYLYFANNANMTEIHIGADVPDEDKITSVPNYTFLNCSSLSEITGLSMVTRIGDMAFLGCSSLENLQDLNDTTTINIGNKSFLNCTSLKCIDLTNISLFGEYAFDGCSNLTALDTNDLDHINDNTEYTFSINVLNKYAFRNTGLNGKTLKFTNINSIPTNVFEGSGLNKFIGTSVATIENAVFKNCAQLLEVQLGNVTTINADVFNGCSSLATIKFGNLTNDFSNITSIGLNSFKGCSSLSLTNLSLPSLTSLSENAFDGSAIKTITNLGQITYLHDNVFQNCTQLTDVTFPNTLLKIEAKAFKNTSIECFIVPEGVTSVSFSYFTSYNNSLKYVELPSTVSNCTYFFEGALSTSPDNSVIMVIKATKRPSSSYSGYNAANAGIRKFSKVYVPDDSLDAYKQYSQGENWGLVEMTDRLRPISQLLTDNPTYWDVYQSGLSNS